jgi:hypothetical protein
MTRATTMKKPALEQVLIFIGVLGCLAMLFLVPPAYWRGL